MIACAVDAGGVQRQNDGSLEEYRMYHRKGGLLIKEGDDAISSSRYAMDDAALRRDFARASTKAAHAASHRGRRMGA
jgi:hypothetical protein